MSSITKKDKPKIPTKIKKVSESEQKITTGKTNLPKRPCLRTNIFWAPIAKISENPIKKPLNRGKAIENKPNAANKKLVQYMVYCLFISHNHLCFV